MSIKSIFLLFFIIFIVFVLLSFKAEANPDPDWLSGWQYRKSHVIENTSGAGTNYQVSVKVYYGSGTDSDSDVYLNGKVRSDFGDVRFTDDTGTELLDYWMEENISQSNFTGTWVSNQPNAIWFKGTYNRTYIVFLHTIDLGGSAGTAKIIYYDHDTSDWSSSVSIGIVPSVLAKYSPTLTINSTGHMIVFYGGYDTGEPLRYRISSNPEDISSWEPEQELPFDYPADIYPIVLSDDDIIVFGRTPEVNYKSAIKSIDGGINWGANSPNYNDNNYWTVTDMVDDCTYVTGVRVGADDRIHIAWLRYDYGGSIREDIYYAYSDDDGETWYNASGTYSASMINKTDAEASYKVFESGSYDVDLVKVTADSANTPYISFSHGGSPNGTIKFATWNGSSWEIYNVTSSADLASGRRWSDLYTESTSTHYIYMPLNEEIEEYKTTDGGESWSNTKTLTTDGALTANETYLNPFIVRNFTDPLRLVYYKGNNSNLANDLYYYDYLASTSLQIPQAGYATFFVEISNDLSSEDQTIYIYYGNSSVTTTSNISTTFIFGDDFDDGDISDWYSQYDVSFDSSNYTSSPYGLKLASETVGERAFVNHSIASQTQKFVITMNVRSLKDIGQRYSYYKLSNSTDVTGPQLDLMRDGDIQYYDGAWNSIVYIQKETWYELELIVDVSADTFDAYVMNWLETDDGSFRNVMDEIVGIYVSGASATDSIRLNTIWIDDVRIRKYVDPEPTHGDWGNEEAGLTYSNDGDDSGGTVTEGAIVNTSVLWNDNINLSKAVFRHNTSGWSNVSWHSFSGNQEWFNETINTNGQAGKTICWNQWANDTSNNWNSTMSYHCFNVSKRADGSSCTVDYQCSGSYCVHNICRSTSTYCGDAYCDAEESCLSCVQDCGVCIRGGYPPEELPTEEEIPEEEVLECPVCPNPTEWSGCVNNSQTRTTYQCGTETNYICEGYIETKGCEIPALPQKEIPIYVLLLFIGAITSLVIIVSFIMKQKIFISL